jgi:hypothetical protein
MEASHIDVQILQKAVAPDAPTLSIPVARALAVLSFAPDQEAELCRLLDKNNDGTISRGEREILEGYVRVGNLLSLLRAKARSTLSARSAKR